MTATLSRALSRELSIRCRSRFRLVRVGPARYISRVCRRCGLVKGFAMAGNGDAGNGQREIGKWMAVGSGVGAGAGSVFGVGSGDFGLWVSAGVSIGASLGLAVGACIRRLKFRRKD